MGEQLGLNLRFHFLDPLGNRKEGWGGGGVPHWTEDDPKSECLPQAELGIKVLLTATF